MSNKRWLSRLVFGAVTVLATAGLVACGPDSDRDTTAVTDGSWESVVNLAEDEGVLNFYSVASELQNSRLAKAFSEEYPGIRVRILRGAGEMGARVSAEIQSGSKGADVLLFSNAVWFDKNEADLLELDVPERAEWPDELEAAGGRAIISTTYSNMIIWNTEIFPDGFTGWPDLLDADVKGKLGTRSGVTPSVAGNLDMLERSQGPSYLNELFQQDLKFYSSGVPMAQAVAAGEIGVADTTTPSLVADLKEVGAPIEAIVPSPSLAVGYAAGAMKGADHPNAALVFMNFMMTQAGQFALNGDGLGVTPRDDVPGGLSFEGLEVLDTNDFPPEVVAEWDLKFSRRFS